MNIKEIKTEEFKNLYLSKKNKDVAKILGISLQMVGYYAKKLGINKRQVDTKRKLKLI